MAREYARTRIDIADDRDFESLSVDAQFVYLRILIPDPSLRYSGVVDWRPNRLTRKAKDLTLDRLIAAAAELEERRYVLFDPETEEALVRSFIRSDELMRNPKMAASVVKAYREIASRTLQAAVISELKRDRIEHPTYSSWEHKDTRESLTKLLSYPDLASVGYTNAIAVPITNPNQVPVTNRITNGNTNGIGNPGTSPDYQSDYQSNSVPIPSNSNKQHATSNKGGYVSTEGHQRDPNEPPPSKCPQHADDPNPPNCHACGDARRNRQAWDRNQADEAKLAISTRARQRAELLAEAIDECNICDEHGYFGTTVCEHNPDRIEINRRGAALARAVLAGKPIDEATTDEKP